MIAKTLFDFPGWRNPFAELEQMKRDMDWLSGRLLKASGQRFGDAGVFPSINLGENNDNYYIRAELPGIDADELDIQAAGNSLSITGERRIESKEGVKYHRKEREAGKFSRIINLPKPCNTENIKADLVNGILSIEIPKSEIAKPRQITVK